MTDEYLYVNTFTSSLWGHRSDSRVLNDLVVNSCMTCGTSVLLDVRLKGLLVPYLTSKSRGNNKGPIKINTALIKIPVAWSVPTYSYHLDALSI